jgi:hypothetical protein
MFKSTVAPRLSILEIKQYSRPCNITINNDLESLSWELTKRPTKFHCSTNQQHPALILSLTINLLPSLMLQSAWGFKCPLPA